MISNANHPALIHALSHLQCPVIRDLAWVIYSPDLVCGALRAFKPFTYIHAYSQNENAEILEWLLFLDSSESNRAKLPKREAPYSRLGKYFEELLATVLYSVGFMQFSQYKPVIRNYQFIDNKITHGEVDFVLQHSNGSLLHLETAVKFYLLRKNSTHPAEWGEWIGPNSRDRLALKLAHMQNKQLAIIQQQPKLKSTLLKTLSLPPTTTIESRFLVKGMLFVHWLDEARRPEGITHNILTGKWLHWRELPAFTQRENLRGNTLVTLNKLEWLTGRTQTVGEKPFETPAPYLVSVMDNCYEELCKVMVVNDYWPETSSPSRNK